MQFLARLVQARVQGIELRRDLAELVLRIERDVGCDMVAGARLRAHGA